MATAGWHNTTAVASLSRWPSVSTECILNDNLLAMAIFGSVHPFSIHPGPAQ